MATAEPVRPAPPERAERAWPRLDTPNVLWYFGAIAAATAAHAFVDDVSNRSGWIVLAGAGFGTAFAAASWLLLRKGWWIPAGLLATAAATFVAWVVYGLERAFGTWPDDVSRLGTASGESHGNALVVELAVVVAALVVFALLRFPFAIAVAVAVALVASQELVSLVLDDPSGDTRAWTVIGVGAALVAIGLLLDARRLRGYGFWPHLIGLLGVSAGLAFLVGEELGHTRLWVLVLVLGALVLLGGALIRRATWAVFGVLGIYLAILHYADDATEDRDWALSLLMIALGLAIVALGMLVHRRGAAWAQRLRAVRA